MVKVRVDIKTEYKILTPACSDADICQQAMKN